MPLVVECANRKTKLLLCRKKLCRAAVVAGGASGIGLAVAERCATGGAQVAIRDVQAETGKSTAPSADRLRSS